MAGRVQREVSQPLRPRRRALLLRGIAFLSFKRALHVATIPTAYMMAGLAGYVWSFDELFDEVLSSSE